MSEARKPAGKVEILPPEGAAASRAVRKRVRRHEWTPRKRQQFLEAVARQATMQEAARGVAMSMTSVRNLRARDPVFDADCEAALAVVRPSMIEAGYQRAVVGWEEPVFQGGKLVGMKRRYSDSILRLMLERGIDPSTATPQFDPAKVERPGYASQEEVDAALMEALEELSQVLQREDAQAEVAEMEQFALAWHGGEWSDGTDGGGVDERR